MRRQDRFEGEAEQPPAVMFCGCCGGPIRHGCGYYVFEDLDICDICAKRFAWFTFLEQAERRTAMPENWL
ncbi:MAG: hypothetical protein WDA65_07090 [Christensenellales bacterium]